MEFLIFYFLFSWCVVYNVFKTDLDSVSENWTNILMSFITGWFVFPLLLAAHLRGDNK